MTFKKKGWAALVSMLAAAALLVGCAVAMGPAVPGVVSGAETPEETAAPVNPERLPTETPAPALWTGETLEAYYVHTVDEFLDALGSDRMLVLDAAEYNLTQAGNYGRNGVGYSWRDTMADGYELVLSGLNNLVILGAGPGETSIVTEPRYANVLRFERCSGVTAANLTAGHTVEAGYCSGGVLYFQDSDDIFIDNCDLYGCGTLGINAVNCHKIVADNTVIRECSYGAILAASCYDVRFTNGKVLNCGNKYDFGAFDLFHAANTTGFAVLNSYVHLNNAEALLRSDYSTGVNMRGCQIYGNEFRQGMFHTAGASPVVDGCEFTDNLFPDWSFNYDGETPAYPVNAAGEALLEDVFPEMEYAAFVEPYDGPAVAEPGKPEGTLRPDGITEYHVTTVDEFLAAIGSNAEIHLDGALFDLTTAANYGGYGARNYYWQANYDGPGLVISGVENLSIVGLGFDQTNVETLPRYADVLSFYDCVNVTVQQLTAGHTKGAGSCSGDVLSFQNCADCTVLSCGLFGCGVNGINAYQCRNLTVQETVIYECSGYGAVIQDCYNTAFAGCAIRDCEYNMIWVRGESGVTWDGKTQEQVPKLFTSGQE